MPKYLQLMTVAITVFEPSSDVSNTRAFLKDFFFLMWTFFKAFFEFVTILLLFYVLLCFSWTRGM